MVLIQKYQPIHKQQKVFQLIFLMKVLLSSFQIYLDITFTNIAKAIAIGALKITAPIDTKVEPKMKARAPKEGSPPLFGFQLLVNKNSVILYPSFVNILIPF